MPTAASTYYTFRMLQPKYFPEDRSVTNFGANLVANLSLPAGTIMGQTTSAAVNDVETLSSTGTLTSGTYTFTYAGVAHTINVTDTATQVASKINANLNAQYNTSGVVYVTVTGGPLSTNTSLVITATGGGLQGQPQSISNQSSAIVGGGSVTSTQTTKGIAFNAWGPYNAANSDGTQRPKGILRYQITTDALGMIYLGNGVGTATQIKDPTTPIAVDGGQWDLADLSGLDQNAVDILGFILSGSLASGVGVLALNG